VPGFGQLLCRISSKELALISKSVPAPAALLLHSPWQMGLQAIQYERGRMKLLDQRRLPLEEIWLSIDSVEAAWSAIKDMVVRGAPAIAIAAALALATELIDSGSGRQFSSADAAAQHIKKQLDYLVTRWQTCVQQHPDVRQHVLQPVASKALASYIARTRQLQLMFCLLQPPNRSESIGCCSKTVINCNEGSRSS